MQTKQIEFGNAKIVQLAKYPAETDPTSVLLLHAPLTQKIATALKCGDLCFTVNDTPRKFEGKIGLTLEIGENESEVRLPNFMGAVDTIRPTKIWKFRVGHDNHDTLGVDLRMHFKGEMECARLDEFFASTNSDTFTFFIKGTQGELFPEAPVHDGSGTKVDMASGATQNASSNEREKEETEYEDANEDGPLPSMREMAGGTTADLKKKRGRPRKEVHLVEEPEVEAEVVQ